MYIVVCHDIVSNRRRNRVMRRLRGQLVRVQRSVFEGEIEGAKLGPLRNTLLEEINPDTDTVRIYHLCARCVPATELVGTGEYVDAEDRDEIV